MTEQDEMRILIRDYEYESLFDGQAIEILDRWLADWLYRKDHCPRCGCTPMVEYGEPAATPESGED